MFPKPPRYLLYTVLEPLGPYIVGTRRVRGCSGSDRLCGGGIFAFMLHHPCNDVRDSAFFGGYQTNSKPRKFPEAAEGVHSVDTLMSYKVCRPF